MITFNDLFKHLTNPIAKLWNEFLWSWNNSWHNMTKPAALGFFYALGASAGLLPLLLISSWVF